MPPKVVQPAPCRLINRSPTNRGIRENRRKNRPSFTDAIATPKASIYQLSMSLRAVERRRQNISKSLHHQARIITSNYHALSTYLRNPLVHTIECVFSIRSTDQWIALPPRIHRRSRFISYLPTITTTLSVWTTPLD